MSGNNLFIIIVYENNSGKNMPEFNCVITLAERQRLFTSPNPI